MYLGVQAFMPTDLNTVSDKTMQTIRDNGFTGVACRYFDPLNATKDDVSRLKSVMDSNGIDPCQAVAQHPDLIDADKQRRDEGIRAMQHMCKVTKWLGAGNLYVRPGSKNPDGSWYPHPDNFTDRVFDELVDSLKQVCIAAESEDVTLAVEGHTLSILNTPEKIRDLIHAVGSDKLRFNSDPVNFIGSMAEAYDTTSVIDRTFDILGEYTVCGHAKDFFIQNRLVLHVEETAIGEGIFDQVTYLNRFEQACPNGYMQIEHLPDERIPGARASFYKTGIENNINWIGLEQ